MPNQDHENKPKDDDDGSLFKGISLTPALTTLFKPTTELVGKEIKSYVKEKIDSWKQKRRAENVYGHVEKVKKIVKLDGENNDESTISQMELLNEWVDGAQDIGPDEDILSEMWQEMLLRITTGKNPNKTLIDKLKSIDVNEARVLLSLSDRYSSTAKDSKERFYFESLHKKGLLDKSYQFFIFYGIGVVWIAIMLVLTSFLKISIGTFPPYLVLVNVFFAFFVGLSIYFLISPGRGFAKWRLSWVGKELVSYAKKNTKETP